jgi:hypothetical protein
MRNCPHNKAVIVGIGFASPQASFRPVGISEQFLANPSMSLDSE